MFANCVLLRVSVVTYQTVKNVIGFNYWNDNYKDSRNSDKSVIYCDECDWLD